MGYDTKKTIIIAAIAVLILYSCSQERAKREQEQQVIGMIKQFCKSKGGIGEDLTEEIESKHGHFTVLCEDGSSATGFYKYPDQISYFDKYSNEISN